MIPEQFKFRFDGDSGVDLATQEIDVVFPDGERRRVVLRLGTPFMKSGETWIRTELENLDRTDGPLCGAQAFQTLLFGISWIPGRLKVFQERLGCRYFWPGSDDVFDFESFFQSPHLKVNSSEETKTAEPGATDNPDDAQRLREDH